MLPVLGYGLPRFDDVAREDALFHYTTAAGLHGIFQARELWSTAYHCANDESELLAGKDVLQPLFRDETSRLINCKDRRIEIFYRRGVDPRQYGEQFEEMLLRFALGRLTTFVSCFCKPADKEDFENGLLSQWRGYGPDGGYAIHFSRQKLLSAIDRVNRGGGPNYQLQDVHYSTKTALRSDLLSHGGAFVSAYNRFLDHIAEPLGSEPKAPPISLSELTGGPLEALLDYLIHTKSSHFREERECRMSHLHLMVGAEANLPVQFFTRAGILVPYTKSPQDFEVLECVEALVIGPGPRMDARFESLRYLVSNSGCGIPVRMSRIPFTRF